MERALEEILKRDQIPIRLNKVRYPEVLWINSEKFGGSNSTDTSEAFCNQFSYVLRESDLFKNINFEKIDFVEALCERYGGNGIGGNGGGARAANIGRYQLKGIGPNCLVQPNAPQHHSYGGLDIFCAANEVINTSLINRIMPKGAIDTLGIIKIKDDTGIYGGSPCAGVILVRDICTRPAHLLHAGEFCPSKEFIIEFGSEEHRINSLYKSIKKDIGIKQYINLVASYLHSCADQFAFSRMARILHGGITESNVSLDGRWIDVPLVGFIPGGRNWSQQSDFYSEPLSPLNFLFESFHNLSKYTNQVLNPNPLVEYYYDNFKCFKLQHCCFLLGLSQKETKSLGSDKNLLEIEKFMESFIISKNYESIKKYPTGSEVDYLFLEIKKMWTAILMRGESFLAPYFSSVLNALNLSEQPIVKSVFINSSKRLFISKEFYLNNTIKSAEESLQAGDNKTCSAYINSRIRLIEWVFQYDISSETVIFSSDELEVVFCVKNNLYVVRHIGESLKFFKAKNLCEYLKNSCIQIFYYENKFSSYLNFIFEILISYEGEGRECI